MAFAGRTEGSTAATVPFLGTQMLSASLCRPLSGYHMQSMPAAAAAADRLWRGSTCRTGVAAPIDQSPDAAGDLNSGGQLCLELDSKGALLVPCLSSCMPALQQQTAVISYLCQVFGSCLAWDTWREYSLPTSVLFAAQ